MECLTFIFIFSIWPLRLLKSNLQSQLTLLRPLLKVLNMFQKTFLRSKPEMLNYWKLERRSLPRIRLTELPLERLLMIQQRNSTMSIKLLMPLLLKLKEMPRLLVISSLRMHLKLLSLLELRGKLLFYSLNFF